MAGGEESNKGATNDVEPTTSGTGWFCQGGYVVTCYHVVKGHRIITVVSGNLPKRKASVMTKDETYIQNNVRTLPALREETAAKKSPTPHATILTSPAIIPIEVL